MNRRKFLYGSTSVAASTFVDNAWAQACKPLYLPGTQLWTVRNALSVSPRQALSELSQIGIREVQFIGLDNPVDEKEILFGLSLEEFLAELDNNMLAMSTAHINRNWLDIDRVVALASKANIDTVVLSVANEFTERTANYFNMVPAKSLGQLDRLAAQLNETGKQYREAGLTFGYHNHHIEFIPVDGAIPFDYLMERIEPDNVKIEFDIGWLAAAGVDAADYLRRYGDRVIVCHLKDFNDQVRFVKTPTFFELAQTAIVEPGAGSVDFRSVLHAMDEIGVQHAFVEVDFADDPIAAIDRGQRHLQELRAC